MCDLLHVPRLAPSAGSFPDAAFHLKRQGVVVNVLYLGQSCPDHVFVLHELGAIPYDDPRAGSILLAMLDANFLLPDPYPPALGRNPVTKEASLRSVFPLAGAVPQDLLNFIDKGVALALQWREDYLLQEVPA